MICASTSKSFCGLRFPLAEPVEVVHVLESVEAFVLRVFSVEAMLADNLKLDRFRSQLELYLGEYEDELSVSLKTSPRKLLLLSKHPPSSSDSDFGLQCSS